ncbi:M16 family metallopeptidase [Parasediminibacterium paludis]|uniref:M16 family metallopeptidase n=1 Tax=Parasediminibacterium paludis TaxID=908966 RepID=A0ABV8PZ75_9BACT
MKKILLYTLFALPMAVMAQVDRSKAPKPGPAPIVKISEPAIFTLPNGLKVFVVQNTKLPRVSATLTINRESIIEGNKAGLTSIAGELLRRGTSKLKKADLDEAIDYLGANISTSSTSVSGSSLSSNFPKVIELMSDIALRPAFPADELEKIRTQALSALAQGKEDPATIARNVTSKLVYGKNHPYGEIETETTIKAVTVDDVKKYYTTYWKPNVAYLVFVGDITVDAAKELATKYFGSWSRGMVPAPVYKAPAAPAKTFIAIVDRPSAVQSNISLVAPIQLQPGSPDAIAADITANILGGGSSARLYKNLREKYGFTYGAYSSISEDKLVGNFTATAAVRNDKTDSAIGQFIYEFNRIRNEVASVDEVSLIKNERNGAFARSLENPATIAGFALNIARYNLPKDYFQNYLKNLATVDAAKVKMMANKYIPANNLAIVIVGNAKEIAKGLDKYGIVKYYDIEGNEVAAPVTKAVAADVTAESVLQKSLDASGGKAIATIKDVETVGTASIMGQSLNLSQKYIVPTSFVQNLSAGPMSIMKQSAKNGVYTVTQQGQNMPVGDDDKEELDEEAALVYENVYLNQKGYSFTLKGIEQVNGKDAYVVIIKTPKGRELTNYYSTATFLRLKSSKQEDAGPQGKVTVSTYYNEYKTFNGVQIPVKMLLDQGQLKINIDITDVKINQGLKLEDLK